MSSLPTPSASNTSFFQTWVNAVTKPREETYAAIASSPQARAMTGYIWVAVTSFVAALAAFIAQSGEITRQLETSGLSAEDLASIPGGIIVALLCSSPFIAVIGALSFAIWVALIQWIAKMFGGTGTNDQLAYTMGAISAPYSLASAVLVLLSAIPYVGLCFSALASLAGLYALILDLMAIKAVNRFGWGPAVGAYFIPGLALLIVCCCIAFATLSVLGLAVGDVFSTINLSSIQVQ